MQNRYHSQPGRSVDGIKQFSWKLPEGTPEGIAANLSTVAMQSGLWSHLLDRINQVRNIYTITICTTTICTTTIYVHLHNHYLHNHPLPMWLVEGIRSL